MEYLGIDIVAAKWGITPRRLQVLCSEGRIPGATRFGRAWMIPTDATKPLDGRRKTNGTIHLANHLALPFPRFSPTLRMTDLYHTPGCAKQATYALASQPYAQRLFAAEIAYCQGLTDEICEKTNSLLDDKSDFYASVCAGMLLAQCAVWQGEPELWKKARDHIYEINTTDAQQQDMIALCICALNGILSDLHTIPDWFQFGSFESLHKDTLPFAKICYVTYLYQKGQMLTAQTFGNDSIAGLAMLKLLPGSIEPMIAQAMADRTVIAEIYLRLTCAVAYHFCKNDAQAIRHIDKAITLALPDQLYGILAEYCMNLSTLIEQRLNMVDPFIWEKVNHLFNCYASNRSRLKNQID